MRIRSNSGEYVDVWCHTTVRIKLLKVDELLSSDKDPLASLIEPALNQRAQELGDPTLNNVFPHPFLLGIHRAILG